MKSRCPARKGSQPLVSVVMPVHNGERFLDQAIWSIRNQTLTGLELIIVENGSTDASLEIAQRHAAADTRVCLMQIDTIGAALARNAGIEAARSGWIAWMDQDDIALPRRLERQMEVLARQPEIGALGTYGYLIGETGRLVGISRVGPISAAQFSRERAGGLIYLLAPSVVFSRKVALSLAGLRQDYWPSDDVDFWSRIADDRLVLVIPEALMCYRVHTRATSTRRLSTALENARRAEINAIRRRARLPELSLAEFRLLEHRQPRLQRLRRRLAVYSQYFYRTGASLLASGSPSGILYVALSFVLYPSNPIQRIKRQAVLKIFLSRISNRLPCALESQPSAFGRFGDLMICGLPLWL